MSSSKVRKYLNAASVILVTLVALSIVTASPFALNFVGKFKSNWALLSNIGQTYGAISALLAAVGIAGVAATILLQIRESRRNRYDATRTRHFELYRMAIEDPSLTEISHGTRMLPLEERKYAIYINFQLEFWLMLWGMGSMNEATLRASAADLFKTEPGQKHWERNGTARMMITSGVHKESRFLQIINEEYVRHTTHSRDDEHQQTRSARLKAIIFRAATIAVLLGTGVVIGRSAIQSTIRRKNSSAKLVRSYTSKKLGSMACNT